MFFSGKVKIRSRLYFAWTFSTDSQTWIHWEPGDVWKPGDESGWLRVTLSCRLAPQSQHPLDGKSCLSLFSLCSKSSPYICAWRQPSLSKALSCLLMKQVSFILYNFWRKLSSCFYHAIFSHHVTNHPLLFSNIKEYIWNSLLRFLENALRVLVCTHYLNKFIGLMGRNYSYSLALDTNILNMNFRTSLSVSAN